MVKEMPLLLKELKSRVMARTGRRLRNLDIEVSSEQVTLRGKAGTFYIKQLAQQGILEVLPEVRLENAIEVSN